MRFPPIRRQVDRQLLPTTEVPSTIIAAGNIGAPTQDRWAYCMRWPEGTVFIHEAKRQLCWRTLVVFSSTLIFTNG